MKRRHQCCCEAANLDLSSAALTSIKLWGSLACHTYLLHFQSHLWEQVFTCCRAFGICTVATHLTSVETTWITQMFACDENTLTRVFILNHNHTINKWISVNYNESHREKMVIKSQNWFAWQICQFPSKSCNCAIIFFSTFQTRTWIWTSARPCKRKVGWSNNR